jgi:hypothetical protein
VLITTDNPDSGGEFYAQSDEIVAGIPIGLQVTKAYLGQMPLAEVRTKVVEAFTSGSLLITYLGHASSGQLASENILNAAGVSSLSSSSGLPIFVALSCYVGNFGVTGYDGLAEALIKRTGAGSVATWAPADAQMSPDSTRLGLLFSNQLFTSGQSVVIGDAIQSAKAAAKKQGLPQSTLQGYSLLGDPALRVSR